ncbi:hypothetical protein Tco_0772172 [Tanacetum coccineum]|uniref:RNA-directed DNA polymerase, eukaryota, Reverse transcriptase zinc-binding domain protein n=1 Tax=Tanacetum coccineum TaxID=301880 RepID=A0ABQ4ZJQ6_9ASTR
MGDENPIRTLGDYSGPSHEGYRNTIELPEGNNVNAISEKLDDTPTRNTAGNPTAQMNFVSTNYPTKEELLSKGIIIPSKLLSLKYLSQSSLAEQNRNPLSPKRVYFVNSIIILNKEDEAKEEGSVKSSSTKYKDHEITVECEEEFEEETEEETEEEEEDNPKHFDAFPTMKEIGYHEWLLKNPWPPWVKAKIRTRNLNNVDVLSCRVVDASLIRFWKDTWLGDVPLCSRYKCLYHMEKDQNCLIKDHFVNGSWSWEWRRPVNGRRSSTDLNNLLVDISSLIFFDGCDYVTSSLFMDGLFR